MLLTVGLLGSAVAVVVSIVMIFVDGPIAGASFLVVEPLMQKIHREICRVDAGILAAVRQQGSAYKKRNMKWKVGRRRATVRCSDCLFLLSLSVTGKRTKCGRVSIRSPVGWLQPLRCCRLAVPLPSVSSSLTPVAPSTGCGSVR